MEAGGELHIPAASPQGKNPGTNWRWDWVGQRVGLFPHQISQPSVSGSVVNTNKLKAKYRQCRFHAGV